jgi:hypothetical protein
MRTTYMLLISGAVTLATGCTDSDSPDAQIRRVIDHMEKAVEARDVGDLMDYVSSQYRDAHGQGPDEAARYARGYFIANQNIHLLTRIEQIDFPSVQEAHARVLVGMASREAEAGDAWSLAADLHEFDIALVREGDDWKVTYAKWKRK